MTLVPLIFSEVKRAYKKEKIEKGKGRKRGSIKAKQASNKL